MADQALVQQGDIVFVSLLTPDRTRAQSFYAEVLGWRYELTDDQWQEPEVVGANVQHALAQLPGSPTIFTCYAVDDVRKAIQRVAELGGTVRGEPKEEDGGLTCGCTDPLNKRFTLYEFLKPRTPRASRDRARQGDLVEVVIQTSLLDRFASFYAELLGWDIPAGGGVVPNTAPSGRVVAAGSDQVVPVYAVDDLPSALARVTAAGGRLDRAVPGIQQCIDDQGTRFGLAVR